MMLRGVSQMVMISARSALAFFAAKATCRWDSARLYSVTDCPASPNLRQVSQIVFSASRLTLGGLGVSIYLGSALCGPEVSFGYSFEFFSLSVFPKALVVTFAALVVVAGALIDIAVRAKPFLYNGISHDVNLSQEGWLWSRPRRITTPSRPVLIVGGT